MEGSDNRYSFGHQDSDVLKVGPNRSSLHGFDLIEEKNVEHRVDAVKICYNPEWEEDCSMSYAGFVFVNGKILAFSDSAGTKRDVFGALIRDTDREPMKKLFANDKIAVVTTGANELVYENKDGQARVELSDLIDGLLVKAVIPENVVNGVWSFIQRKKIKLGEATIMIAGVSKRNYGFGDHVIYTIAEIGENNYTCKNSVVYRKSHCTIGNFNYNNYFDYHPEMLELEDTEQIRENIEKAVAFMNERLTYNPVGGKIIVKEIALNITV